jgi:hypothetical protein
MFTYTGPFQWLAELQLRWMDSYSEKFTFVLTMVALVLPAWLIWKFVEVAIRRLGPGVGNAGDSAVAGAAGSSGVKPREIKLPAVTILPLVGVIVLGIGLFMYWRGATAGPLTAVKVKDLEEGKKPASSHLKVEGVPMWEETISFKKSGKDYYVPLVSPGWKPGVVAVYVECKEDDLPRAPGMEVKSFTGMRAVGGLPGPVRVAFEKNLFKPAEGYVVIETREDPVKLVRFAKWPTWIGAGLVGVGLMVWGVKKVLAKQ